MGESSLVFRWYNDAFAGFDTIYQSTMGGNIAILGMLVERIDQ